MIEYKTLKAAKSATKSIESVSVRYRDQHGRLCCYTKNKHGFESTYTVESIYARFLDQAY